MEIKILPREQQSSLKIEKRQTGMTDVKKIEFWEEVHFLKKLSINLDYFYVPIFFLTVQPQLLEKTTKKGAGWIVVNMQ